MSSERVQTYLSFRLKDELYAIDVSHVIEVLEQQKTTEVPDSPDFIDGVINFRGDIVPVINLYKKLHINTVDEKKFVIIIIEIHHETGSLLVSMKCDSVQEVVRYADNEIKELPDLGTKINSKHVKGIIKDEDNLLTVLNIDSIFLSETTGIKNSIQHVNQNN